MIRAAHLAVVTLLTAVSQCNAAPAHAVSPPPIDDSWLPQPAEPAPPQPTEQREICSVPAADTELDRSGVPAALRGLDLPSVWQLSRGAGQRVAVIDTGVSPHRRLPAILGGGDYVFTGDGTQDCDGHGTVVAGIIAAAPDSSDASGFTGVAPDVTLISIRQSSNKFGPLDDPTGVGVGDVNTMAMAVRTAADAGASVINISSVACTSSTLDDRALGAALAYAVDVKDSVVVAAAGNAGGSAQCPEQSAGSTWETATVAVSPAWYDDYVLTVGSISPTGDPSAFTLAGPWVDVAACGKAVVSLSPVGDGVVNTLPGPTGSEPISGTSYAAPVVSGVAALVRARFPELTARDVMQRIENTAHHPPSGWDPFLGSGVVDALAAISTGASYAIDSEASDDGAAPVRVPAGNIPEDSHARQFAVTGALVCLAVLVAVLATTASAGLGRLGRRRSSGIARDAIVRD
jgi:membrane-anchored mycosin MYCP